MNGVDGEGHYQPKPDSDQRQNIGSSEFIVEKVSTVIVKS